VTSWDLCWSRPSSSTRPHITASTSGICPKKLPVVFWGKQGVGDDVARARAVVSIQLPSTLPCSQPKATASGIGPRIPAAVGWSGREWAPAEEAYGPVGAVREAVMAQLTQLVR
jgi:hypothetical protein